MATTHGKHLNKYHTTDYRHYILCYVVYYAFIACGMLGSVNIDSIIYSSIKSLLLLFYSLYHLFLLPYVLVCICFVLLWTMPCPSALAGMMHVNT